jgi:3-oxoadipate enol-lactonase
VDSKSAPRTGFIRSGVREIYFERQGIGPAVLFCHGAGGNAAVWWQQVAAFRERHTCLSLDLRCFGRSVAPVDEFRLDLFMADLLALLDHQGIARAAVVGQSLGGMVGLRLALAHPERVGAFVCSDSSLAIDHPTLVACVDRHVRGGVAQTIEQRSLGASFAARRPDLALLYTQLNHFNPSFLHVSPESWRAAMLSLNQPEALLPIAAMDQLRCPALFVVGREDPIVPFTVMQELGARLPGSEVCVVEEAAHSAYFSHPEVFNAAVLDFLSRRFS